ncbi:MAG: M24 family metallopeptidase, partial [Acidobacteriota bacterium]
HEEPNIPNYGRAGSGPVLKSGMTIAVEPMATLGDFRVFIDIDGWTVRTNDRSLAAHFEHTILVTDSGAEILTQL